MQVHNQTTNKKHESTWPSTWHWVSKWHQLNSYNCWLEEIKWKTWIVIAIKDVGLKHEEWSERKVRVCKNGWQSKPWKQRIGLNSFWRVVWSVSVLQLIHYNYTVHTLQSGKKGRALRFMLSLTDLAVAEMYWTTISRLVLRSFPRRGALRSSFRFMSSCTHKESERKAFVDTQHGFD